MSVPLEHVNSINWRSPESLLSDLKMPVLSSSNPCDLRWVKNSLLKFKFNCVDSVLMQYKYHQNGGV